MELARLLGGADISESVYRSTSVSYRKQSSNELFYTETANGDEESDGTVVPSCALTTTDGVCTVPLYFGFAPRARTKSPSSPAEMSSHSPTRRSCASSTPSPRLTKSR